VHFQVKATLGEKEDEGRLKLLGRKELKELTQRSRPCEALKLDPTPHLAACPHADNLNGHQGLMVTSFSCSP